MSQLFPPFDPDQNVPPRKRFRPVSMRVLIPNLITLMALAAGFSAVRMAYEGHMDFAVYLVLVAALFDALDGRIARLLRGTSRFGAELDSLADFLSFGAVPALILYFWEMKEAGATGWIAALVFVICAALRLARFNIAIDDPTKPAWMANFFTGMPTPAGAIVVMLPLYLAMLGLPALPSPLLVGYTIAVGLLMVSTVPVFSGKKMGTRVPRDMVVALFIVVIALFGLLVSYPAAVLAAGTIAYLISLPFGYLKARRLARNDSPPQPVAEA
jgi:CDP-diacylglycerol--serine O-phosphatidyltransferase